MTPQQYVQDKAAGSGSSFYYAFLFLPPRKRAAITAFYAFCREVDDVVDEIEDQGVAAQTLHWWRIEVANSFAGNAQHPVMKALMPLTEEHGINEQHLQQVIDGCDMDLRQTRYLDFASLKTYCHLVAGVVGEVAARIFGQSQNDTTEYAHSLGLAFQLTNIIRDVGEDAMRGRIYLPIDELQRFNVTANDLLQRRDSAAFQALMKFQCDRALDIYEQSLSRLPAEDWRAQKPGLMMASIYRTLLLEIADAKFPVLTQRVALTPLRKMWLAWKMQALGRF